MEYFSEASAKTGLNVQKIFVKAAKTIYKDYILYNKAKLEKEKITINKLEIKDDNDSKSRCC